MRILYVISTEKLDLTIFMVTLVFQLEDEAQEVKLLLSDTWLCLSAWCKWK